MSVFEKNLEKQIEQHCNKENISRQDFDKCIKFLQNYSNLPNNTTSISTVRTNDALDSFSDAFVELTSAIQTVEILRSLGFSKVNIPPFIKTRGKSLKFIKSMAPFLRTNQK